MFFCRHQLLRAPAQRHFSNILTTRHAPGLVPPPTYTAPSRYARSSSSLPPPDAPPETSASVSSEKKTRVRLWPPSLPEKPHSSEEAADVKKEGNGENKVAPPAAESSPVTPPDPQNHGPPVDDTEDKGKHVAAYLAARETSGQEALTQFSSSAFRDIVFDAVETERKDVLDLLVEDAAYVLRKRANRFRYPAVFLLEELGPRRHLKKRHTLTLMRALREHSRLKQIRLKPAIEIAISILKSIDAKEPVDGELLEILHEWFLQLLQLQRDADKPDPFKLEEAGPGHQVPRIMWPLFRILLALAQRGEQEQASALMRKLIEHQAIHSYAIEKTDLGANDNVYVVLSVLVRTCLQYGWFSRATSLLVPVISARQKFTRPMALLIIEWLQAALDEPRYVDLTEAAAVIIMHFQRAQATVIHDTLLQQFYQEAAEAKAGELAQAVYRHSREVTYYAYNPPGGAALIWFIGYLRGIRRDVHLLRVLTKHIVEEDINVVPFARNAVVYNAAACGFTLQARTLWERWSEGEDRKYIVASSATMLRVVSAFMNTEATVLRAVRQNRYNRFQIGRSRKMAASRINTPDGTEERVDTTRDALSEGEETDPASDAPQSASPPPPHDDAVQPLSSDGADVSAPSRWLLVPSERGAEEREEPDDTDSVIPTREELLARAADIRRFTEHVFDAYYEVKQPFETADRMTVNALARGAFMLGRDELAFELFNLMRRRDMRLDLHDLNVIISVVAKANPERGVERIHKMIEAGLEPDAVTYGTVIHWAIFHGNAVLVKQVIDMARAHGLGNFSFKTLAAILHATVAPEFETPASEQLETVEDILTTMLDLNIIPTPNVGWDCIKAALAAEDPVMAFRFWKELLKDKVEFVDVAQVHLRRRIGDQIQEHYDAGWLGENRARVMLSELGFEVFSLHDRRRLAAKEKPVPGIDAP
ncbi:hypothetical protein OH76DRAFT_464466 [Lentinus brumalis]|uniref:Pentacotripeptide-repeat region of PRORP domain-containing protein n=1 Tax=Lentinus brumalis TaxID=2498619 RepID=A0A371DCF8_9APHY|nr:hypothetical protein OH76DRAFT_464466 [Polyporus brumalis]